MFRQHRKEIGVFAEKVGDSEVGFVSQSYPELWNEWQRGKIFSKHTKSLQKRYIAGLI